MQRKIPEGMDHRKHDYEKLSPVRLGIGFRKPFKKFSSFLGHFTLEEEATKLTGK
jgi:hypothetical protein